MNITKVFLIEFSKAEVAAIRNTILWLRERNTPLAADKLQEILSRYDDGEALTAPDVEDMRVWVQERLGKSNWTQDMWRAVR
jgi:hypothetical protein